MNNDLKKPRRGMLCPHCKAEGIVETMEYFINPTFIECVRCHQNKSHSRFDKVKKSGLKDKKEKLPVI